MKRLTKLVRLLLVPAIWLAFVPYAIGAGNDPGLVVLGHTRHYPTGPVIAVCAVMAVESLVLFAMLAPMSHELSEWRRPLKALAFLLLAFFLEPMVTDMPGYAYVNAAFLFTWSLVAGLLVLIGLVASKLTAPSAHDSSIHAA